MKVPLKIIPLNVEGNPWVKSFLSGHDSEKCMWNRSKRAPIPERSDSFTVWRIGSPVTIFGRVGEIKRKRIRQNALRPSPCGTGNVTDGTFIERRVEVGTHPQPSQYSRSGPRAIVHLPDLCACLNRNLRRLRRTTYRTDPVQVRSCFINVYGPSYISLPHLFPQRMWDSIAFSYSILILHFTSSAFREPFILLPTPII